MEEEFPNSLKGLLRARDMLNVELTLSIIKMFNEKLDKALQFYLKKVRKIYWYSIETIAFLDDYVYVSGLLEPEEGDVLLAENKKTQVDKKFINSNKRSLVKMILPIKSLEEYTPEQLYIEIKEFYEKAKIMTDDEIIRDLMDKQELDKKLTKNKKETKHPVIYKNRYEFDLDSFTKEEIMQIKHLSTNSTKN